LPLPFGARLRVRVAVRRDRVPRLAEELAHARLGPLHAGVVDVARAIDHRQHLVDPRIAPGARDLLLRVVLRHAPVVELPDVAARGVEYLARFLGDVVKGLRPALCERLARVLTAQLAHEGDELVLRLEEAEPVVAERLPRRSELAAEVGAVAGDALLEALDVGAPREVAGEDALDRIERPDAGADQGIEVAHARGEPRELQLHLLRAHRRLVHELLRRLLSGLRDHVVDGRTLLRRLDAHRSARFDVERRAVHTLEDVGDLGVR
jgi:hypothetical protein